MVSNLSMEKKLFPAVMAVILLSATLTIFCVLTLIDNQKITENTIERYGYGQEDMGKLGIEFQKSLILIRDMITLTDPAATGEKEIELNSNAENIDNYLMEAAAKVYTGEDVRIIENIKENMSKYRKSQSEVLVLSSEKKPTEAYSLYITNCAPLAEEIAKGIEKISGNTAAGAEASLKYMEKYSKQRINILLILGGITLLVSTLTALCIGSSIMRQSRK